VKVSIVINTDARAKPLAICLESLRYLRYPDFEVVVVAGPTRDGTHELCESWGDAIKYGRCPVRNLSQSRNIGIAMASGDIVAFIDDDAVPEPEWLDDIVSAFEDPGVGVAGGFLHDHTGKTYQWKYGTANRFGTADTTWKHPTPEFNFPNSFHTPQVIGANSVFRRSALVHVGGFDEEYEYFLDETDVTVRIVDAGWTVVQLDRAFVHHKFAASHIRNHAKVLTSWYSVIKNKAYFALMNGSNHASLDTILEEVHKTIAEFRRNVHWAMGQKFLSDTDLKRFENEADRGLRDGLARGLNGERRYPPPGFLRGGEPFVRFDPIRRAEDQRCYVFLSRGYPPDGLGGIARFTHQLARSLGKLGHQVHVLTAGAGHDRVDFEDGVWVHRIVVREQEPPANPALRGIPTHIWDYSRTMLGEALEIASRRRVDAVEAPIWDVEGAAFIGHPAFPLVTSLHTTLQFHLDSNPELKSDERFMREFAQPMLRIERLLLQSSDAIHGNSHAIVEEIESAYGLTLDRSLLRVVSHGLEDWTAGAADAPSAHQPGSPVRLVFIGRLELRKGVDVVMDIAPIVLREHPEVLLEFFGNDRLPGEDGRTWRERFESLSEFAGLRDRVVFHGEVSDERLRQAYAQADVILAPSRFESFGLVHLEGAMYGKPVVGSRSGGMVEVIEDGVTGMLPEPGNARSLSLALRRLLADAALRERMGRAARRRYLEKFTSERMAADVARMFAEVSARRGERAEVVISRESPELASLPRVAQLEQARSPQEPLRIAVIGSVLAPYDAIANDLVRKVRFLRETPGWQVSVLTGHNERKDIDAKVVQRVSDLLLAAEFRDADVIIWHFGIWYPLFDAILVGNGHARQAVVFHNITPLEHTPPGARHVIERSFAQLENLRAADAIWPDSRENFETLLERDFDPRKMTIQPLAVDRPPRQTIRKPHSDAVRILFVGRIVPAKGIADLIEAMALLDTGNMRVHATIVGNLEGAEPAFRESLLARVAELKLSDRVEFAGMVSDDKRDELLAASHILAMPSYHEGFCVPVIEALRAGMLPVVYSAANLRYIADGLCVSAPPGNVQAFAAALSSAVADVTAVLSDPATAKLRVERGQMTVAEFEQAVASHVDQFEPAATAQSLRERVNELIALPRG
jgi:hypothetical protein